LEGKAYFASDFHLGAPDLETSRKRERIIVQWLDEIGSDAGSLYLVGDVFDFWHDYTHVVPKGFVSYLAKIKALVESGVKVYQFKGNHDMWLYGYLSDELGVEVLAQPHMAHLHGKTLYLAHGDGLGPGDYGYKLVKGIFSNKLCQFIFRWIHPDLGVPLASYLSGQSRLAESVANAAWQGEDKERLMVHAKQILGKHLEHIDYFVFGHRHYPIVHPIGTMSAYVNLGDWIGHNTFGVLQADGFYLKKYLGPGKHMVLPPTESPRNLHQD
jgi:UDP-2,3-diacylglucosamine hydrolase